MLNWQDPNTIDAGKLADIFMSDDFLTFTKSVLYNIAVGPFKTFVRNSDNDEIQKFLFDPKNNSVANMLLSEYVNETDPLVVVSKLRKEKL